MAKQLSSFHRALQSDHFAEIEFPVAPDELAKSAHRFLEFLALPDQIKRQLHFPATVNRASADGFTDKSDIAQKDPKQFFHWSPQLKKKLIYQQLLQQHTEIAHFFVSAETLYNQIEQVLLQLFTEHLTNYKTKIFNGNKLIDGILRFLCYRPQPQHRFGARGHFDKGFSTLAVADSAPGLRIGCCDHHPLKAVNYGNGTALFLPAWMIFETSGGEIKPVWHDVIQSPEQQDVNGFCARWSIVFFVNSPNSAFSSWDAVHTPLH